MRQYTNFGGEKIEVPEVVRYQIGRTTIEIHGVDSKDCCESLENLMRRMDVNGLEHNIFMYTPKLADTIGEDRQILNCV